MNASVPPRAPTDSNDAAQGGAGTSGAKPVPVSLNTVPLLDAPPTTTTIAAIDESLSNLTPADVYFGRAEAVLLERERIKRQTIANRRLQHQLHAA